MFVGLLICLAMAGAMMLTGHEARHTSTLSQQQAETARNAPASGDVEKDVDRRRP